MKEQFERNGAEPVTTTQPELSKLIKSEIEKYVKVIKAAGVKAE